MGTIDERIEKYGDTPTERSLHLTSPHDAYDFLTPATRMGEVFAHLTDDHGKEAGPVMMLGWEGRWEMHRSAHL